MPLPTPILDDRSYQQIRDELVRRIPIYSKEWTDHNASDPAITLIELFAFLGENLLFRFNQIPEATRIAFLKLLSVPLRPATTARAMVQVVTQRGEGTPVPLGSPASAGDVKFETLDEVHAFPISILAISRKRSALPSAGEAHDFALRATNAAQLGEAETPVYYVNQVVPEDPLAPDAAPVDFRDAVDATIWIAVLGERNANVEQLRDNRINIGFVPDQLLAAASSVDAVIDDNQLGACAGKAAQGGPETIWEYSTGTLDAVTGQPTYRALAVRGDTTRGLSRQGVVRLEVPPAPLPIGVPFTSDADLRGTRQFPPEVEDPELEARLLFWIRGYRRSASELIGRVTWLGANATEVLQQRKSLPEFLGTGSGQPNQKYVLLNRPVIPNTAVIEVEDTDGRFRPWTEVETFDASDETDRHFVVDYEAGVVRFGAVKGLAPQVGQRIRATSYRYGGGAKGNVPPGKIQQLDDQPDLTLEQPMYARGGADSEAVQDALERIPAELRRRDRAVAASDFRELALATPGANVGRAETLPLFHPPTKNLRAAGIVTVLIWPTEDRARPGAPMPDRTQLDLVCQWLDARRLVTTELWVLPPTYKKIAIAIGVTIKPGFGIDAVRSWVELVIRQYLAPLPPYGPEGQGWPLGRKVIARELEAAALQVEGVHFLTDGVKLAELATDGTTWLPRESPDEVALDPWVVPELAEITVVEGSPLAPGARLVPPDNGVAVPIPTLREEC